MLLPLLGGTASVWATCVVFFQAMLLAGYLYAHFLGKLSRLRNQILVHLSLMFLAVAFLPIRFGSPTANPWDAPVTWILQHLFISAGLPFAVLSASAPLLQSWLARTRLIAGRDPYFLYATSNAGSLLALGAYPILVEPRFGVNRQSALWSNGYGLLLVLFALAAGLVWKNSKIRKTGTEPDFHPAGERPVLRMRLFWLAAAFVPSALMLAVTNHISQNLGSFPFLWVLPLAVYLLTFVMAFARKLRAPTRIVSMVTTAALLLLFPVVNLPVPASRIAVLTASNLVILFLTSLLCHSSLADRRPPTKYLTRFYFAIALGGALGGIFTAIVAPAVFNTVFEYPLLVAMVMFFRSSLKPNARFTATDAAELGLFAVFLGAVYAMLRWTNIEVSAVRMGFEARNNMIFFVTLGVIVMTSFLFFRKRVLQFGIAFSLLVGGYAVVVSKDFEDASRVRVARNFFGVKKVLFEEDINMRKLLHGDTMHGRESLDAELAGEPLSYYHRTGPVGEVMEFMRGRRDQHVAVVGLGVGSMAAYGGPDRRVTFFEIDPQVRDIANDFFTFMRRCGVYCETIIGDGRLSLQSQPDGKFDLLVLDAFNSDSIPAHLVSREAVRMYMSKLKPDGILVFHVSNRYLDVEKLASAVLSAEGIPGFVRYDDDEEPPGKSSSHYVVALRHAEDLKFIAHSDLWIRIERPPDLDPWTDDYSNMLGIVR
ncbi:MAG: fused MFS/spermidine synthase [Acidobacteria bacterium]|nr:fused MFS/spermidine synthase [Acidobacteriota bacterium]